MERLTNGIDYCQLHCDFGKENDCFFQDKTKCYEKNMYEKLRSYEDAEEQGLLFKLPITIGSIVYRINEYAENPLIPMGVISVEIKGLTNTFKEVKCKECIFGGEFTYRFSDIGKTLFLTKEDAEKFLAELVS